MSASLVMTRTPGIAGLGQPCDSGDLCDIGDSDDQRALGKSCDSCDATQTVLPL